MLVACLVVLLAAMRSEATAIGDVVATVTKVSDTLDTDPASGEAWGGAAAAVDSGSALGVKESSGDKISSTGTKRYTKRCATKAPTAAEEDSMRELVTEGEAHESMEHLARLAGGSARLLDANYGPLVKTVSVYWHVVQSGSSYSEGHLDTDQINRQITVLNQKHRKTNFQFVLAGVDYTTNADWFSVAQNSDTEAAMKMALHKGTMQDYNVYSANPTDSSGDQVAGFTVLPVALGGQEALDGSVILYDTLPGGTQPGLDMGMTLVHESGHWLGLLHTFQNGCSFPGDNIGDTVYEASASFDCTPKQTCPGINGDLPDPIHNPMNYSPDSCMTQFTSMQCRRMRAQWYSFRGGIAKSS